MEINGVVPGRELVSEVRVHHVRLAFLEARQAGPVASALNSEAARNARSEAFRSGDLPYEVNLPGASNGKMLHQLSRTTYLRLLHSSHNTMQEA